MGQDPVAITRVRNCSWTSVAPVSAMALSALSKGLFMKSFDSTAYLVFGNVIIGLFPNELIHAAALPRVGFGFLF